MRYLKTALKAIISIGLLTYLIHIADPEKILESFSSILDNNGLIYLVIAFILALLSVLLMSFRWQVLLRGYNLNFGLFKLYGFYLIGMFFNNFLPTSIGGDVIRIYKVVNESDDRTVGFASVIIERMMGIAATTFLAIFSLFFISQQRHNQQLLIFSLALFLVIFLFFYLLMRNRPFIFLLKLFDKFTIFKIGEKFNKLLEAIHYFRDKRRFLGYVFIFSMASQIAIILMNWFLVKAMDLPVDLIFLFMLVPVTFMLTMLPSINGIGIRDLGYVGLLSGIGISNAAAISLSFLNLLLPMLISSAGAVLFIIQKNKTKLGEIDALDSPF